MNNAKLEAIKLFNEGMPKRAIARHIGVDPKTIRRWLSDAGQMCSPVKEKVDVVEIQKEHATRRANILHEILVDSVTKSNWPVINTDAIIVEPRLDRVYNYSTGDVTEQARSPRTYVSDVLRVAPITEYKNKTFLFTRAQNATAVHSGLLQNMRAYAAERNAAIVVGPDTYETAWWHETNPDCRDYDESIRDYLCFGRLEIGPNLFFAGEMNILTTATTPMSDLMSYSMGKWCIIPHSKQQLESVPSTDPNVMAHQILTTGSITLPKVTPRKAGIKSIFHHIMGFVVVEFDEEGQVFCRHVNSEEDGSFYDLWWRVEGGVVRKADQEKDRPDYIMPGDVHRAKLDQANHLDVQATFGFSADGTINNYNLLSTLQPRRIILQDLHDGQIDSHYTSDDLASKVEMSTRGRHKLETEIDGDARFLFSLGKLNPFLEEIIVDESNHDLRLERYVREGRYRTDGFNARLGLQLEDRYLQHREDSAKAMDSGAPRESFSLFEFAVRKQCKAELTNVSWVYDGNSRVINDVEVGHHGFRGTNGAKASISGYVRIGRKISYGDKHSPSIRDGAFQAGVLVMHQGYNKGPSSWGVSHILQYANGKRCIITLQNGKFCNVFKVNTKKP